MAGLGLAAFVLTACEFRPSIGRFVKISVEIEYDGTSYTFERWFECVRDKRPRKHRRWPFARELVRFRLTNRLFTARLNTGEGLLFVAPRVCDTVRIPSQDHEGTRTEPRFEFDFSLFVPLFLIADNADDPSFLEAYVTDAAATGPPSRLRLLSFSARYAKKPSTDLSDPAEAMPWLSGPKGGRQWQAHFLAYFGERLWRRRPKLAVHLENIEQLRLLTGKAQYAALNNPLGLMNVRDADHVFGATVLLPDCDRPKILTTPTCMNRRAKRFAPLRRASGRANLVIDSTSPVRLTYYPSEPPQDCMRETPVHAVPCVEVQPNVIMPVGWQDHIFDPDKGELIELGYNQIRFREFMRDTQPRRSR